MIYMLVLVLPSLNSTTSQGISSLSHLTERGDKCIAINHIYHTLLRKMSWGWYRVVSPTTTMQRSRRWIPVPMWLQHTRRLGKSWRIKSNHETVICMLGLVLPSLDTTTSQEISSDRKRGEMNSNHIYHTLLRKMRWGKCQLVSPTTTIQMLRRWIPVPTWLQHTRRLGKSWRKTMITYEVGQLRNKPGFEHCRSHRCL